MLGNTKETINTAQASEGGRVLAQPTVRRVSFYALPRLKEILVHWISFSNINIKIRTHSVWVAAKRPANEII